MKVNVKIVKATKKLDKMIIDDIPIQDMMFWDNRIGQITCYVVIYSDATQYLCVQEKDNKTYSNYYNTYEEMLDLYNYYCNKINGGK